MVRDITKETIVLLSGTVAKISHEMVKFMSKNLGLYRKRTPTISASVHRYHHWMQIKESVMASDLRNAKKLIDNMIKYRELTRTPTQDQTGKSGAVLRGL